jgi:lipopolysaccharide transport system permease protein
MLASAWRNRSLIVQLSKRDVLGRYRGSLAGMAWSFFNPLLMLGIYTFVFSTIFKSRWALASLDESRAGFAIILFVGIIIHGLLSECINKAPGLILNNANYVKKVVFPLEILPWVVMSSALFHAFISLLVLLLAELAVGHGIPWTVVLIPMVILPLVFVVMGMTWFISATSVYVRDIAQMTGVFASALMFLAPVFYPLSSLPEQYRAWMYLNPLTFIIEQARGVLIAGTLPDWGALGGYFLLSLLFAWIGFWWFQRSRRGFSDVI